MNYGALIDHERLRYCYRCGKCTSGCDVSRLDPSFRPHRLLHLLAVGAIDALVSGEALWKCTTCFTCTERCPQGIRVAEILWIAKVVAVLSDRCPGSVKLQREELLKTGRLIPLDLKKRNAHGLPPLPEESPAVARIFALSEEQTP